MNNSVFAELGFWLMTAVSVVLPFLIYALLLMKRSVSRASVLLLGLALVVIAGFGLWFLQYLQLEARATPSMADDAVFDSEVSIALYLFPLMFGGVGVNLISHVLVTHLVGAERRFAKSHPDAANLL
jgi:hypothetical protein